MLTEEAHHMFVARPASADIQRTCEAMRRRASTTRTRSKRCARLGVIDLPTIQKSSICTIRFPSTWFGLRVSPRGDAFNASLKGRFHETRIDDDHRLESATIRCSSSSTARSNA